MQLNPSEISELIKSRIQGLGAGAEIRNQGTVISVTDGICRIHGLSDAMQGEMLEFPGNTFGLALNLERDSVGAVILGEYEHISEGDVVKCTGRILEVPIGPELKGRVVNALGQPIDGLGPINAKLTAPNFIVTASQNNLLLAEARERGWITSGTTSEYFTNGVRLHMQQMASYDAASAISADAINTYLAANPLNNATALKQINEQYWVSSLMNGPEAFANFRRSGFPALVANPFTGREVPFINRLTYPNSEISVNKDNVGAAISAQGADDLATKVWWHK